MHQSPLDRSPRCQRLDLRQRPVRRSHWSHRQRRTHCQVVFLWVRRHVWRVSHFGKFAERSLPVLSFPFTAHTVLSLSAMRALVEELLWIPCRGKQGRWQWEGFWLDSDEWADLLERILQTYVAGFHPLRSPRLPAEAED